MAHDFPTALSAFKDDSFDLGGFWVLTCNTIDAFFELSERAFQEGNSEMGQMYQDWAKGVGNLLIAVLEITIEQNVAADKRDDGPELLAAANEAVQAVLERSSSESYGFMDNMDA